MKNISIQVINPSSISEAADLCVAMARITQRGEKIASINDLEALLEKPYSPELLSTLLSLPHPTLQKFGVITVAVIGASRRFLAQVTRHQNEVKFMSASLQYSDYSNDADFLYPIGLTAKQKETLQKAYHDAANVYKELVQAGVNRDEAGYVMPQALRNVLVISATPYQWKHMILQRTCRRNTKETRYIFLLIQEALEALAPEFMKVRLACCPEGFMTCGRPVDKAFTPSEILRTDFRELYEEATYETETH